ncbi:MAG: hypothetical protein LBF58_00640 [Deltaproteobacteria bacterium]|jgi:hypothetical protein|nr:hypothetical protein [Deltaproteobacteria bacterium]
MAYALELGPQRFAASGLASVEARVVAVSPGESLDLPKAEFYWRESRATLGGGDGTVGQYVVVGEVSPEPRVTVRAGGYSRIGLTARLTDREGVVSYAQADFNVYAREGSVSPPSGDSPPPWPFFELTSDQPLYWPQTGQTFFIALKNLGSAPAPLSVWEEGHGGPVALLSPDADGRYGYVPPNDPRLDKLGTTASKRLVFVHPLPGGGTASLSLYVHRSRTEKRNRGAGLAVFAACVAGASGVGLHWLRKG